MSNIFLEIDAIILVLQKKQENPTIDMAKIQIKSERDSLLLGDYFQSWSNLTPHIIICNRLNPRSKV